MKCSSDIHHRRSVRLKHYDYSQAGAYFVTICTQNKEFIFGDVINSEIQLNDMGNVAQQCWIRIPKHFPNTVLDEFIVMPNHIHGIVIFNVGAKNISPVPNDGDKTRAKDVLPLRNDTIQWPKNISPLQHGTSMTIGSIIRGFKIGVTKWARENGACYAPWQRNYYEHIIRNEEELQRIREYIANNPTQWDNDENNLNNISINKHA